ncbi:hypothetical protein GA0115253_102423 [Streptomyces sp. Termitarium-T10T-6]|nr:hypothetical protein GA0115253_102423 [Streptomyces sp. Termitarium-T10T-6]
MAGTICGARPRKTAHDATASRTQPPELGFRCSASGARLPVLGFRTQLNWATPEANEVSQTGREKRCARVGPYCSTAALPSAFAIDMQ